MKKQLWLYLIIVVGIFFYFGGVAQADIDPTTAQKLLSEDSNAISFGYSVSVSGNTAVIGNGGEAYVFTKSCPDSTTWQFQQKLIPPEDNADDGFETFSWFGEFVSIDGDTIIVGGGDRLERGGNRVGYVPGACIYTRSGTAWELQQKISAYPPVDTDKRYDYVKSVVVDNDTAVVVIGSMYPVHRESTGNDYGIAYVFIRSGGVWTLQQEIIDPDPAEYSFGTSVALNGDTLLIGAALDDENGGGFRLCLFLYPHRYLLAFTAEDSLS
ncbi:MAG: hypothetical protein D3903_03400 [Candidatus Electrothrix sp. GM3_4]|nr:hypothetical protein [Candidatus Electrothrix sp. GM3_4]